MREDDQAVTYCRRKCGNNFHVKCLRVWIDHKLSSGDPISCPMCRSDMTSGVFDEIRKDEDAFNVRFVSHIGKHCAGCSKKNILGNLFHCLLCDKTDLCHFCYHDNQHSLHQKFLLKKRKDSQWEVAVPRIAINSPPPSNFLPNIQVNERIARQMQLHGTMNQRKQGTQLQLVDVRFACLRDFLVSCFTLFKDLQQEQQSSSSLNAGFVIVGQEMNKQRSTCAECRQTDLQDTMRKLNCGHAIHHACLVGMLKEPFDQACPTCFVPFYKGLKSASTTNTSNNQSLVQQTVVKQLSSLQKKAMKTQLMKENVMGNQQQLTVTASSTLHQIEISGQKKALSLTATSVQEGSSIGSKRVIGGGNFRITKPTQVLPSNGRPPLPSKLQRQLPPSMLEQRDDLQSLMVLKPLSLQVSRSRITVNQEEGEEEEEEEEEEKEEEEEEEERHKYRSTGSLISEPIAMTKKKFVPQPVRLSRRTTIEERSNDDTRNDNSQSMIVSATISGLQLTGKRNGGKTGSATSAFNARKKIVREEEQVCKDDIVGWDKEEYAEDGNVLGNDEEEREEDEQMVEAGEEVEQKYNRRSSFNSHRVSDLTQTSTSQITKTTHYSSDAERHQSAFNM